MNLGDCARQMQELLGLTWPPIAVAFQNSPPPHTDRVPSAAASGCSYWKLAAQGQTFYTDPSDHLNCPIGAHTHGVALPPEKARELQGHIQTMVGLEYLKLEEVPGIPQISGGFGAAVYSPLAEARVEPQVVLVRGNARQMMLLAEAAQAAGCSTEGTAMGRPTCAVIPAVLNSRRSALSLGCIGNRVYTDLADDESYFAVPGDQLSGVVEKLAVIVTANNELERFHRARRAEINV